MLQYTAAVSVTAWLYYFESMTYRTIGSSQEKEGIEMVTLFVIGIFVFVVKLIHFAVKAAWGITKGILFVIGIPALLIVLFVAGVVSLAVPMLILALLGAFLWPVLKGV